MYIIYINISCLNQEPQKLKLTSFNYIVDFANHDIFKKRKERR